MRFKDLTGHSFRVMRVIHLPGPDATFPTEDAKAIGLYSDTLAAFHGRCMPVARINTRR